MRVLRIRLHNLNSLKGRHEIDFTKSPLVDSGLFVITGPTGAGKTTILDALTLALYGKAARYGTDSNPEHVMTRRCGECSAEVEFEVRSGTFRAVWERRRARKKPDGALQPAKRYVYDAAGEPLAQQIREAEEKIVELIGLNYDRFLRSVLLAQGDFARFLKANANERAEVLESLTGTVIFSQLGALAQSEAARREREFESKENELGRIEVLEEKSRRDLLSLIETGEQQSKQLRERFESGSKELAAIERLEKARHSESLAVQREQQLVKEHEDSRADLERLERHRSTNEFTSLLAELDSSEKTLKLATQNRGAAEKRFAENSHALAEAQHSFVASVGASLRKNEKESARAQETLKRQTALLKELEQWFEEHDSDATLSNVVADAVAALAELRASRDSLHELRGHWITIGSELTEGFANQLPERLDELDEETLRESLPALLEKVDAESERVAMSQASLETELGHRTDHLRRAQTMADVERHRHTLVDGEPCPLCGATKHPYAIDTAPDPEIEKLRKRVSECEKELNQTKVRQEAIRRGRARLENGIGKLLEAHGRVGKNELAAEEQLAPVEIALPASGREEALVLELRDRDRRYREQRQKETDAKRSCQDAEQLLAAVLGESEKLREMLSELTPGGAASQLQLIEESLPDVDTAAFDYQQRFEEHKDSEGRLEERKRVERNAMDRVKNNQAEMTRALSGSAFVSIDALREARVESEQAERLAQLEQRLTKGITEARAVLSMTRRDIEELLSQNVLEGEAALARRAEIVELQQETEKLIRELTTHREQLRRDDENLKRREEVQQQLGNELTELKVWRQLKELIGSHDGSKFRRYAQSISLDILTRRANRHLQTLSDRYLIRRDEIEPLKLQIEDLHQAGVRRPMASLSGGESFLVSLALALGLSELAGRNVRIDSLFIDEGFGTLDPETLEVALAALESLRQDDKMVGLISHVEILKERIHTQIVVEKRSAGMSQLRIVANA
ncbi:MAG: AAA family ATPase [Planctomycetota bacterium]